MVTGPGTYTSADTLSGSNGCDSINTHIVIA